jgi:hypothetical protein
MKVYTEVKMKCDWLSVLSSMFHVHSGARIHKICRIVHCTKLIMRSGPHTCGICPVSATCHSRLMQGEERKCISCFIKLDIQAATNTKIIIGWFIWGIVMSDSLSLRFSMLLSLKFLLFVKKFTSLWCNMLVSEIVCVRSNVFRRHSWNKKTGKVCSVVGYLSCGNTSVEIFHYRILFFVSLSCSLLQTH